MPRPDFQGHWGHRPGSGPPNWGPGRRIVRRAFGFVVVLMFLATAGGAVIATGLAAVEGPGRWIIPGIVVVLILTFGAVVRRTVGRSWAPVSQLIDATTRLGDGDSSVRLKTNIRGPFTPVAGSFNLMAERLEAEDVRRRRLLADLGHELRTPMTVIRGQVEAVLDGLHPPESLAAAIEEIGLMERLLEDLRVLSLTEAGQLQLHPEAVDVVSLVTDVVTSFSTSHAGTGIATEVRNPPTIDEIEVDPHRLHQVLANLVSNATNQMDEGGRLVIDITQNRVETVISVSDTGPGIPADQLDRIFDRFVKAGEKGGSGLGLSIARDLVEAHGGTLTAENLPSTGARFTIRITRR